MLDHNMPLLFTNPKSLQPEFCFRQEDLDNCQTAACIIENNTAGKGHGSESKDSRPLLGKVIKISEELYPDSIISHLCVVQVSGLVRLRFKKGTDCNPSTPVVGGYVGVVGEGYVVASDEHRRGLVLAVYPNEGTCDILL